MLKSRRNEPMRVFCYVYRGALKLFRINVLENVKLIYKKQRQYETKTKLQKNLKNTINKCSKNVKCKCSKIAKENTKNEAQADRKN